MSSLNKGQKIGDRYVLTSRLHAGSHAQSWLAQDLNSRTRLVIKVANDGDDQALNQRLLRNEFDIGVAQNHPAIARYYEHAANDGLAYVTREHCEQGDLSALRGRSWRQVVPLIAQLCDALSHLHDAGFVHRDVKARNVLLTANGNARLIDFGVASQAGDGGLRSGGSAQTASPAQRDGAPPSASDDAWAVGLLLFDIIAQIGPDEARTADRDVWPDDVPDDVRSLARQLLHPQPAARPAPLSTVARALERALDADQNATLPPDEFVDAANDLDVIEPVVPADSTASTLPLTARTPGSRRGVSHSFGVMALGLFIVAALAAIYFLRTLNPVTTPSVASGDGQTPIAVQTAPSTPDGEPPQAIEPWKLAQEARLRDRAEEELEQLLDKQFVLEEKKVEVWALEDYEAAKQLAIDGDRAFRRQDFQASFEAYRDGNAALGELVERSENLLDENLRAGQDSLIAGNAAAAIENFELVLKVEPKNAAAKAGLARAANLDEVIALVEQARELEQYGEPAKALALFRQAAQLDPQWSDASAGARRVDRAMAGSRFSSAMSDGFAALSSSRFEAARAAFARAERIRPGTSDVTDALSQLEQSRRSASVSTLRERAEALERGEDYSGALAIYREARALDSNLGFARDGEKRNAERVELLETLSEYNDDPDRLMSDSVYDNARDALARAQGLPAPGRELTTAMARLTAHLATSRVSAQVTLSSDNLTDVLVYRVGRLGRFDTQSIELRPGRYTAVGSRAGYRDVRREFRVGPGGVEGVVDVRCEERI